MKYKEYTPSDTLKPFIKCFWTLEDEGEEVHSRQRVVPDGCMEMIFHYGDSYRQYFDDGSFITQPSSFIFGQLTKYIELEPTGISGVVSARFLPGGLAPFLNMPVTDLENKAVSLDEIFGEEGKILEKSVLAAPADQQRIQLIETFLLAFLTDPKTIDAIARDCADAIIQSQGQIGIIELADKMGINRRSMERKFSSVIGMSPKQLSRAVRLQETIKMLQRRHFSNLTSLAYENGYYDQAHFSRDFKELTGMSPKSFYSGSLRFAALFASAE